MTRGSLLRLLSGFLCTTILRRKDSLIVSVIGFSQPFISVYSLLPSDTLGSYARRPRWLDLRTRHHERL